ncbi:MAG: outer membrane protein assembly factor BamB family protein, partial [Daejeonella sp.]
PVATNNRVFIVAPDNAMTCFNALNGQVIWRKKDSKIRVRESISLSTDSNMVFVKTMEGEVLGISATASQMEITWHAGKNLGYEISPTPVKEFGNLVFAPTSTGEIYAFDRESGDFKWSHKISNCLVNQIMPINAQQLIATTMDGVVAVLNY